MKVGVDDHTERLTETIIGSAFEVVNELGHGFLEAVYRKALVHEMKRREIRVHPWVSVFIRVEDRAGRKAHTHP